MWGILSCEGLTEQFLQRPLDIKLYRFNVVAAGRQEVGVSFLPHHHVGNFFGSCPNGFALSVEIGIYMNVDFGVLFDFSKEIIKGSPAFQIVMLSGDAGDEEGCFLMICGCCDLRK